MKNTSIYVEKAEKRRKKKMRFVSAISALSVLISGSVAWRLRGVGISLANDTSCGIEEHIHDESCFGTVQVYEFSDKDSQNTNAEDSPVQVHDDGCLEQKLICGKSSHTHSVECCDNNILAQIEKPPEVQKDLSEPGVVEIISDPKETGTDDIISLIDKKIDSEVSPDKDELAEFGDKPAFNLNISMLKERIAARGDDNLFSFSGNYSTDQDGTLVISPGDSITVSIQDNSTHNFYCTDGDNKYVEKSEYITVGDTTQSGYARTAVITANKAGVAGVGYENNGQYLYRLIRVESNVTSDREVNKLYRVMSDGSEIDYTEETIRTAFGQSEDVKLRYYVSQGDAYENQNQKWMYGHDSTGHKTELQNGIMRIEQIFTVNGNEKFDVKFGNNKICTIVSVNLTDEGMIVDGQEGLRDYRTYTEDNPYIMSVGDSFNVYATTDAGSGDWIHCSFDIDQDNTRLLSYKSLFDGTDWSKRRISTHFTAVNEGKCQVRLRIRHNESNENDKNIILFWVDISDRAGRPGVIYVKTALGEVEKDRVHENYIGSDYVYIGNSETNPYLLPKGQSVVLCYYSKDTSDKTYFFISGDEDKNKISMSHNDTVSSGIRKLETVCTARDQTGTVRIKIITGDNNQIFYVKIIDDTDENEQRDHADIEITEGGYYEVESKSVDPISNITTVTIEKFDTIITNVNHCYIYDKDKTKIQEYSSSNYSSSGTPGKNQYELTSKFNNGGKKFKRSEVDSVVFDVSVTLKPSTKKESKFNGDGAYIPGSSTITDISYEPQQSIPNAIFTLDNRSVIDACNKCPNHSGLDFNVSAHLNTVITSIYFQASKKFVDESGNDISNSIYKEFNFELVDKNGNVVATASNDDRGIIDFKEKVFLSEGVYEYTLREKKPVLSETINGNVYVRGSPDDNKGYFIDKGYAKLRIAVSKKTDILMAEISKMNANGQYEPVDNWCGIFVNKVIDEKYSDLNVKKVWASSSSINSVKFRIIQKIDGTNTENLVKYNGATEFELSTNNEWKMTFNNLPEAIADLKYTYRVEEVDVPSGFVVSYSKIVSDGADTLIITNTSETEQNLWIKKEWLNSDGSYDNSPPKSSVEIQLKRQYIRQIPITVNISSDSASNGGFNNIIYANSGGSVRFEVEPSVKGTFAVEGTANCSVSVTGSTVTVSSVRDGAQLNLKYTPDSSAVTVKSNVSNNFLGWEPRGVEAKNVVINDQNNGLLMIENRNKFWQGVQFDISKFDILKNATELSVSVEGKHWADNGDIMLDVSFKYIKSSAEVYDMIKSIAAQKDNLVQIKNNSYRIPSDAQNELQYIVYQTQGEESNYVWIAMKSSEITAKKFPVNYLLKSVVQSGGEWSEDNSFERTETITWSEGWNKKLEISSLNQTQGVSYRYYVVENGMTLYKPPVYYNDYISKNTQSTPIIVRNQKKITYALPETGGPGTSVFFISGTIIISVTVIAAVVLSRKRKLR